LILAEKPLCVNGVVFIEHLRCQSASFLVHGIIEGVGGMPKRFTLFLSVFLATLFGCGSSGNNASGQTSKDNYAYIIPLYSYPMGDY
jgi:hypothetical protein